MKKFNGHAGTFAASLVLTILVVAAELVPFVKTFLAAVFTHHWIGKAVIISLAFIAVGFGYQKKKIFNVQYEKISWYGVLGSLAIIFLFYIIHYIA